MNKKGIITLTILMWVGISIAALLVFLLGFGIISSIISFVDRNLIPLIISGVAFWYLNRIGTFDKIKKQLK